MYLHELRYLLPLLILICVALALGIALGSEVAGYIAIYFLYAIVSAAACAFVANTKNRDIFGWAFIGLLLGLPAILVVGLAEAKRI